MVDSSLNWLAIDLTWIILFKCVHQLIACLSWPVVRMAFFIKNKKQKTTKERKKKRRKRKKKPSSFNWSSITLQLGLCCSRSDHY